MKFPRIAIRTLIVPALAFAFASSSSAVILIDYDSSTQSGGNMDQPNIVQDNVELGGGFGDDQQREITLAQNSPNPWSSTAGSGYDGPAFSIVWESIAYNENAGWDSRDSNPLNIRAQTNSSNIGGVPGKNGAGNLHLAIFFDTPFSTSFDATSSITLDVQRFESLGSVRWLVRDGSTYYLSQSTISGDTVFDQGSGLLTESWAVYDIASGADFDQGSAVYSTLTSSLTNITAVGIMADKDSITSTRSWLQVNEFTVDAVPEPSTYAILAGIGALGFVIWRRRRLS